MQDGFEEPGQHPIGEVRYPRKVLVAGTIWIAFGGFLLLYLAVWFLTRINDALEHQRLGSAIGATLPGTLIGAGLVYIGARIILGRAKDFGWFAIGSIALALFIGLSSVLMMVVMIADFGFGPGALAFLIGLLLGPGGLLTAGVLALVGRQDYLAWRKSRAGC